MVENKYFVTDAHCHIYPEKIASRAVAGTDNFYHEHSVGSGTVEGLMEMGDKAGVDRYIVQSVATRLKALTNLLRARLKSTLAGLWGLALCTPTAPILRVMLRT